MHGATKQEKKKGHKLFFSKKDRSCWFFLLYKQGHGKSLLLLLSGEEWWPFRCIPRINNKRTQCLALSH
jgi:hypothetical protein